MPLTNQSSPTLYDRVGGVYSIATVIDDFIDPIMVDTRLNVNQLVEGPPSCASGRL
jgi:hemoglobin